MDQLYKYLPPERIDVVTEQRIRFTQLPALNDPLESRPLFSMSEFFESQLKDARTDLNQMYEEFITAEPRPQEEIQQARELMDQHYQDFKKRIENWEGEGIPLISETLFERDGGSIGVLSLSAEAVNPVMWAQYAQSYRGFAIGLKWNHEFLHLPSAARGRTDPKEVIYRSVRPRIHMGSPSFYDDLYCTKSLHWSYEREYRVFRVLTEGNIYEVGKDALGFSVKLFDLPPTAIDTIIFGYRAERELVDSVLLALKPYADQGIRFCRVRPQGARYELELVDLEE